MLLFGVWVEGDGYVVSFFRLEGGSEAYLLNGLELAFVDLGGVSNGAGGLGRDKLAIRFQDVQLCLRKLAPGQLEQR